MATFTQAQINEFGKIIQEAGDLMRVASSKDSYKTRYALEFNGAKEGCKFLKIWKHSEYVEGDEVKRTGTSIWAFVDADGNLWKPASTKAPAKNFPRGTVSDLKSIDFLNKHQYGIS